MDRNKQRAFVQQMGRKKLAKGGAIRKNFAAGSAVAGAASGAALGSVVPGIGTAIGAIGGFISSLFGGGPQLPNIVDPVTGQQITDANGQVVASQQALQNYASTLQGQNGAQSQTAVIQALGQIAGGTGPNPAQAMLAEATGANVSNQNALAAGQRGASSNVGLIQRQAAQQGAATQQQAVGEAATLQANQSLNALNAEGTIAGQQVQETNQALSNAGSLAATNQGQVLGAQTNYNSQIAGGQNNVNETNSSIYKTNQPLITSTIGGALAGTAAASAWNSSNAKTAQSPVTTLARGGNVHPGPHMSHVANYLTMFKGGESAKKVPALLSPKERYLSPEEVKQVQHGANPLKLGKKIPGKAKVKGDSLKNDTVEATLEEGGVVLPRHITLSMNPDKARLFVLKSLEKKRKAN